MSVPLAELISGYTHFCAGSLPQRDPERAVEFVLSHPRIIPFWPELPHIASERSAGRAARANAAGWDGYRPEEASGLYCLAREIKRRGLRPALLKAQLLGPLSTALYASGSDGSISARLAAARDCCMRQIEWQRLFLGHSGCPLIFVLDEPGFVEWEKLGRDERQVVREIYSYLYVRVGETGNFLGMHSCAAFCREALELAADLFSFDLRISLPAAVFAPENHALWREVLGRGGALAAGVFPAVQKEGFEDARQTSMKNFREAQTAINDLAPLRKSALLLAADCGHAGASEEWVEFVYREAI